MKELQELRNYILNLKNIGVIKKTTEITILHKLNAIEKQLTLTDVVRRSEQLCTCEWFIKEGIKHSINEIRKNKCNDCKKAIT